MGRGNGAGLLRMSDSSTGNGRKNKAVNAGLKVSELKAEIIVETAIVSANCRKKWPVMPLMNAHGTNTALEHQAHRDHGARHLIHGFDRRGARRQPLLDVMLDRLDHDDGVIHHDADRQDQPEQGQVVEAETQEGHHGEGADDGDRHRHQWNDG